MRKLAVISEREFGEALAGIKWVALGSKPVIEIGYGTWSYSERALLVEDLTHCIEMTGERVLGFVMERKPGRWSWGFYRFPWAMDALLFLREPEPRIRGRHYHWVEGLLYGFGPSAIQEFNLRAGSTSPACPDDARIVEILPLLPGSAESDRVHTNNPPSLEPAI